MNFLLGKVNENLVGNKPKRLRGKRRNPTQRSCRPETPPTDTQSLSDSSPRVSTKTGILPDQTFEVSDPLKTLFSL